MTPKEALLEEITGIYCDQCNAGMINGYFCHETGCPNSHKVFKDGRWMEAFTCPFCGYGRLEDQPICDCMQEMV